MTALTYQRCVLEEQKIKLAAERRPKMLISALLVIEQSWNLFFQHPFRSALLRRL